MESQLEEAQQIALTANHKYEDSERKFKIVMNDLERIIERAEEFEGKNKFFYGDFRIKEIHLKFQKKPMGKNAVIAYDS